VTKAVSSDQCAEPRRQKGNHKSYVADRKTVVTDRRPNPGTAFYVGYNDDLNRNGFSPFTGQFEPGLRRNTRTFFIKLSYLFRRSI